MLIATLPQVTSLTALAAAAGFPRNLNVCLKTVCFKIPEVRGRALVRGARLLVQAFSWPSG